MDDLFKPTGKGKKGKDVDKETKPKEEQKEYHNIFMTKESINLLDKIALTLKLENKKYTKGDAVFEGIKLLAKEKGIKL